MDDWKVVIPDRLPAYISQETFLANQQRLRANRTRFDTPGVPRNGSALLAGLLVPPQTAVHGAANVREALDFQRPVQQFFQLLTHIKFVLWTWELVVFRNDLVILMARLGFSCPLAENLHLLIVVASLAIPTTQKAKRTTDDSG